MNKKHILFHLSEARKALEKLIALHTRFCQSQIILFSL